jgi:multicomponent Na+:H+ antiporter subunit B
MEIILSVIIIFMILGAIYALHSKDLLSGLISMGVVGYGLVICFLLLKAPDLAIVQIVVESITLIIMVSVVLDSTRDELKEKATIQVEGHSFINARFVGNVFIAVIIAMVLFYSFRLAISNLDRLGEHVMRMARAYIDGAAEKTGSANLVTGVVFDFRGYDTLGEATILFTAVIGVLTVLRLKGKK